MLPAHVHDVTYDIFGKKHYKSSQRAQQEIYRSNLQTLKSKLQAIPNLTRVFHLSHFDDLLIAEIPDSAN